MKIISLVFLVTTFNVFGQEGSFKETDSLLTNPYMYLGKTEFQILDQGRSKNLPGTYWKIQTFVPDVINEYEKYIKIETGSGSTTTLLVSSKTSRVFAIRHCSTFRMTFDKMKDYLVEHSQFKIKFNEFGYSNSLIDERDFGWFIIKLETISSTDSPCVTYFGQDIKTGEILFKK